VERPLQDEAANNNRDKRNTNPAEAQKENQRPDSENRTVRRESELTNEEKRELQQLKQRDREVRAHEAAHKSAAGDLARGGAQFETEVGPDGRRYAVGGEVQIDTSKVAGDPQATINKAERIRRAATAPAQPSAQDRAVAAEAAQMKAEAQQELNAQKAEQQQGDFSREAANDASSGAQHTGFTNSTEPAPVGELLDVIV
jgi:hypothetical protein